LPWKVWCWNLVFCQKVGRVASSRFMSNFLARCYQYYSEIHSFFCSEHEKQDQLGNCPWLCDRRTQRQTLICLGRKPNSCLCNESTVY
jgi:hypothetical protein